MIKADLVTGFLGAGKTTFLKKYAEYFLSRNVRTGLLINDHGAVNVDVMLLAELEKMGCILESVAGACDRDCHMRRFKTKLIALAMCGCQRVIIEPSGLFDTDEFFDSLREDPLDRMYEPGSVLTVADAALSLGDDLSELSEYMLGSQCAHAGRIILSKTQLYPAQTAENTVSLIRCALSSIGAGNEIDDIIVSKSWDSFTDDDMKDFAECGCRKNSFVKKFRDTRGFSSLYFMNTGISPDEAEKTAEQLLENMDAGRIFRVKGFARQDNKWFELNAAKGAVSLTPADNGQEIIIVIGEDLNKEKIQSFFGGVVNA